MSRAASLGTAVLMVALLASGCFGPTPGPPPGSTTALEGRVLDSASHLLQGAQVRVLATDLNATTDAGGRFAIQDVPAGALRLVVSLDGYATATRDVEAPAGGTARVDIVLQEAPAPRPDDDTERFVGTVACGLPQGTSCQAADTGGQTLHHLAVRDGLVAMIVEIAWTPPAEGLAATLAADVLAATPESCGALIASAQDGPPLRMELADGFPITGGHVCVQVRGGSDAVVLQQTYTLYVSLFYWAPPAPGFTALPS